MSFKSKNDIPYLRFLAFTEEIKGSEDVVLIGNSILKWLYPNDKRSAEVCINELELALLSKMPAKCNFKIDLDFKKCERFIDASNYLDNGEIIEFLKCILRPKYFWQKIDFENISLADVECVLSFFVSGRKTLKNSTNIFTTRPYRQILKKSLREA